MKPSEYCAFFVERVTAVAVDAWEARTPGQVSPGLGHAVLGWCRRVVFADGTGQMYGDARRDDLAKVEGPMDPGIELLFTHDTDGNATHNHGVPCVRTAPELAADLAERGLEVPAEWSYYGAVPESMEFGPQGGRELVGETVRLIELLWRDPDLAEKWQSKSASCQSDAAAYCAALD
jgi:hypothetical protein